jgi:outer membrane protein assembly factor BamB
VTGTIAVIDIATGKTQWSVQTTASGQRRGFTALTAIPAVVFAGGRDGVRAFASDSGRALWGFHMLQHVQTVNELTARGAGMGRQVQRSRAGFCSSPPAIPASAPAFLETRC